VGRPGPGRFSLGLNLTLLFYTPIRSATDEETLSFPALSLEQGGIQLHIQVAASKCCPSAVTDLSQRNLPPNPTTDVRPALPIALRPATLVPVIMPSQLRNPVVPKRLRRIYAIEPDVSGAACAEERNEPKLPRPLRCRGRARAEDIGRELNNMDSGQRERPGLTGERNEPKRPGDASKRQQCHRASGILQNVLWRWS
jgi:hypothetical protein